MLMYCCRHVEEIRTKDAKSKREKRAREKITEDKETDQEDRDNRDDSDFQPSSVLSSSSVQEDREGSSSSDLQPSSVLPPSDPPSPSSSLTPHLTDSPYDANQQQFDDNFFFNRPSVEYESAPPSETSLPIHPKQADLDSLHTLRVIRVAMVEWMALGPVKDWTATFCTTYDEAATRDHGDTQEAIDTFLRGVVEHVRQGKEILAELGRTSLFRMEKGDRLIAGDMQETLHRGVAILEAHLSLAAPSCPLPSNSLSQIRAYEGFGDDY